MRVLQIGADRSKRGTMMPGSPAYLRQKAYAEALGALDIIGYTLRSDPFTPQEEGGLRTFPTRSISRLFYGLDALFTASKLPWPEVISTQDAAETGLLGLVVSRFLNVPLHVQLHTDMLDDAYARHSLLNRLRRRIAHYVLSRASRIRVVSDRIRRSIETRIASAPPVAVLPIYVDIGAARQRTPDPSLEARLSRFSTKLLFVGRLESEKNPCLAIDAFASAPQDACLIVVGAGSERAHLEKLAAERGVSDRVFFEGETESAPYYHVADILLVTSRYEGYGLVIVEALAAGKPVLSTDVGAARELGAIIAGASEYPAALRNWIEQGPRTAQLTTYPYKDFGSYVAAYCEDIRSAAKR